MSDVPFAKMEPITVDPDFYAMHSSYHTEPQDFASETTSLASTIAKGRLENGRRYQAIKDDDYWGPSDEQQFEAFEIGHMVFLVLDHNEPNPLFRAPIGDSPKNILDIGTGQGSWAIDVADLYPTATVDDILREWTWREPFDFIHLRLMYGAFDPAGWEKVYQQAYDALEPGGWIEQMELDVRVYSDDKSLKPSHELYGWGDMFIGCSERAGDRSLRTHETMRGAIEKAGFIDVHEVKYKIPLGPWAKDKLLKEAGHLQFAHWNAALEGWAMWLLTHHGMPEPWTKEEVQVFLAKIRTELKNPHIHAYEPANRVWARKPTLEEQKAREEKNKVKVKVEPST
ncbi:hypothetical protein N7533_005087 [Penicillium manginii]|uniref:uncharacterized protein n=1 Tax=Penicillium manginii TaxID=203109 RepID=UPI002547CFB7|nr:uncharacterized protein N7533_005087 [Penicillium manginii]KAJ5755544.1 hypothetical protein N7533_005087 [Penicillium manginii]